jgi:ornithine--oxo-acid transaminase
MTLHYSAIDLITMEKELGADNYRPLDVVLERGEGIWVWDTEGRRYLDCLSAYSAVNQGHSHPRIRQALIEQSGRLSLTSRAFRNDQLARFYEEIAQGAAHEQRRRGGRDRDQGGAQMGL